MAQSEDTGLPSLPMGARNDVASPGGLQVSSARGASTSGASAPASRRAWALTPKAPPSKAMGEYRSGERTAARMLGKGTVGLGPQCNVMLKKCDRDVQKRWLQARVADLGKSKAEKEAAARDVVVPKDRYTQRRSDVERLRELEEDRMDKVRVENANAKKENKERMDRLKLERQAEMQERVRQNTANQRGRLRPFWQWQNGQGVWVDFSDADCLMLEATHSSFDAGKALTVPELCIGEGPFSFDFDAGVMRDGDGAQHAVRRKLVVKCVQHGHRGSVVGCELEDFRHLCDSLTTQMRCELDEALEHRSQQTRAERERKGRVRTQQSSTSGDTVRTEELRRRVQDERKRAHKKHKLFKERKVQQREGMKTEIQEARKLLAQRKQERLEKQERAMYNKYKEAKTRQQEDAGRRRELVQREMEDRKRNILAIREGVDAASEEAAATLSGGVMLSRAQARVRKVKLDNVSEIHSMKMQNRALREMDVEAEVRWKQYLLSTVRSPTSSGPSPNSIVTRSPETSPHGKRQSLAAM